jgi:threonine synthase
MLRVLRETGGEAIAVSEEAIQEAQGVLARLEGVWTAPEAAATVEAMIRMKAHGAVGAEARIVLVLTGAGIKNDPPPLPRPVELAGGDDEIVTQVQRALAR